MTDFLLKSTLCLGLLFAVYFFLLEKEKMHHFNRFYLLFSLLFSMVIPFVSFEIYVETIQVIQQNTIQAFPVSTLIVEEKTNYLPFVLWSIYGLITAILVFRFIINLVKIQRKINSNTKEVFQNSTLILLEEKVLPHTFLNYIFINKEDYENRKIEDELFTHELTHVRQKHTLDILFIEILKTLFWFNPILMFYKKAIQLNHEFLADEKVVKSYNNVPFYQNLLLEKASWNNTFYLASNLNFLVTKKRLIMMTTTTSKKIMLLKKIALLPLFTGLIYFLSVETIAQNVSSNIQKTTQEPESEKDKRRDHYYAGVQIRIKDRNKNIEIDKVYEDLTLEEKRQYLYFVPVPNKKKSPSEKEFKNWKNVKVFAIWIDGKNVPNSTLDNYTSKDIAFFSGSFVHKNARTKQHPQEYQFQLYTHKYFDEISKKEHKFSGSSIAITFGDDVKENKSTSEKKKDPIDKKNETNDLSTNLPDDVYKAVEKKPDFPGGIQAFYNFVGANFKVPEDFKGSGKVFMQFIVEPDGSLSEITTIRELGFGTGDEAKRILEICPKWIPGEQDGKPVRVLYSLPISVASAN